MTPAPDTATAVVVFTRDLRVHDNPVLATAARTAHQVVPVFVHDTRLHATGFAAAPRQAFLADCLTDLDAALRDRGAALLVRHGDLVTEVCRLVRQTDAHSVHIAADVSGFAARRQRRLADALSRQRCRLVCHDGVHQVVPSGAITPHGSDHFAVFTPYHRRWTAAHRRDPAPTPRRLRLPPRCTPAAPGTGPASRPDWRGGESEARKRLRRWLAGPIDDYHDRHDDLAADATSRLSPYLHFGCLSAIELVRRATRHDGDGAAAFVRQLAWRDFHHQVLAARPAAAHQDYRSRQDTWRTDPQALAAWQQGHTGIPIVDAGMRQLATQGWMHNRARLIVASFLAKTLYLDWRSGARHFQAHLLDADLANNQLNWQWVAGTGTDTRPNRVLNPVRQAQRFDPTGDYTRRWVPELASLDDPRDLHQPWRLGEAALRRLHYPAPIVDLDAARDRFHHERHR